MLEITLAAERVGDCRQRLPLGDLPIFESTEGLEDGVCLARLLAERGLSGLAYRRKGTEDRQPPLCESSRWTGGACDSEVWAHTLTFSTNLMASMAMAVGWASGGWCASGGCSDFILSACRCNMCVVVLLLAVYTAVVG
jgi:hypothetical protein